MQVDVRALNISSSAIYNRVNPVGQGQALPYNCFQMKTALDGQQILNQIIFLLLGQP
jgi:hypothetical protein